MPWLTKKTLTPLRQSLSEKGVQFYPNGVISDYGSCNKSTVKDYKSYKLELFLFRQPYDKIEEGLTTL